MTNATVAETVKGTDGQNILVKYKDGEKKKVVVPEGTPIVTFVAGDKSELKPGAKVIIFKAVISKDDGTLEAARAKCRPRRDYTADVRRSLVIRGRCVASSPESRDSPTRNCASEVWSFGPSRNDENQIASTWSSISAIG